MLSVKNAGVKPQINGSGQAQPTLCWDDKPVFKFGPMSETSTFAFKLGSNAYDVEMWSKWQSDHGMGYVRCYPEQGWGWSEVEAKGRLHPFNEVGPLTFDLDSFNDEYWQNMKDVARVLHENGIILHIQLVQVCYFKLWDIEERRWQMNYWNPENNVNDWTSKLEPAFPFSDQNEKVMAHWERYLTAILDAIGEFGNVLLDVGNELHGAPKWVGWNLSIVDAWEKKHGKKILKGLDYTHMPSPVDVLADPRYDIIMTHAEHVDDAPLLRILYGKPVVSVISRDTGLLGLGQGDRERQDIEIDSNGRMRRFHWRCFMNKVQGVGDYGKMMGGQDPRRGKYVPFIDQSKINPTAERTKAFAEQANILSGLFNELIDYEILECRNVDKAILDCSTPTRPYMLSSWNESIIYLDAGWNKNCDGATIPAHTLRIDTKAPHLRHPGKATEAILLNPTTGERSTTPIHTKEWDVWAIEIPAFVGDLAVYIKE